MVTASEILSGLDYYAMNVRGIKYDTQATHIYFIEKYFTPLHV